MPYGLRGFRAFCRLLVLEDGSTFRLAPFQVFLLGFYFAGVTELVILLPKKQGKTTLLAALALYHLLMVPSAKCFVGASSGEQATWLYDQAAGFVLRSGLERRAVPPMSHRDRVEYEGVFEVKQDPPHPLRARVREDRAARRSDHGRRDPDARPRRRAPPPPDGCPSTRRSVKASSEMPR